MLEDLAAVREAALSPYQPEMIHIHVSVFYRFAHFHVNDETQLPSLAMTRLQQDARESIGPKLAATKHSIS